MLPIEIFYIAHYTQTSFLDHFKPILGPYLLQPRRRYIYKFVYFCPKNVIFRILGEDMRKFGVLNIASISGKYIKEIKNITWVLAQSEIPFHLFFYRYRCACLYELATEKPASPPKIPSSLLMFSPIFNTKPPSLAYTCINSSSFHLILSPDS